MNNGIITLGFRWTTASGIQRIDGLGGGSAFGPQISADGSTIVGTAEGLSITQAVRWTQPTGSVSIGPITDLPLGDGTPMVARGVSGDGSVIVGSGSALVGTNPPQTASVPFRWTAGAGAVGVLDNGQFFGLPLGAIATSVSADGSVLAGQANGIWRWTAASGFEIVRSGAGTTDLQRLSGDGNTLTDGDRLWRLGIGLQPLTTVLTDAGCPIGGWTNLRVTDTSFNGRALCGYGTNPAGQTEAWYATIPAPGVSALLVVAGVWTARRRRD